MAQSQKQSPTERPDPNTVVAAKVVELALIQYTDPRGILQTGLAVIGENRVQLLDSQALGLTKSKAPVGLAAEWLRKGIFEKLGRE